MKRIVSMAAIAATAFIFAMCNNNGNIPVESNWEVEHIYVEGSEIAPSADHNATLAFLKDGKIAGDSGCNRFFGNFSEEKNTLKFENVGSTRMMCPDMAFETAFLQTLSNTASYRMGDNGTLTLKDNNGNIIAILKEIAPVALEN